jgi:hypothetical protein
VAARLLGLAALVKLYPALLMVALVRRRDGRRLAVLTRSGGTAGGNGRRRRRRREPSPPIHRGPAPAGRTIGDELPESVTLG